MTQKDFQLIAELIQGNAPCFSSNSAHANFAWRAANKLEETNERFDRAKFIMACMPAWMIGTNKANVWERLTHA